MTSADAEKLHLHVAELKQQVTTCQGQLSFLKFFMKNIALKAGSFNSLRVFLACETLGIFLL